MSDQDAHGSREDPPRMPPLLSAPQLAAKDRDPREPILEPILRRQSLALLYGPRGIGKTFLALGIAWAAASGKSFLSWKAPKPRRVCYVDGEMSAFDMRQRLGLFGPPPDKLNLLLGDLNPYGRGLPDLGTIEGQGLLYEHWGRQPELVIFDNLASLVGRSGSADDRWHIMQRFLVELRRYRFAVVIVHHANDKGRQRGSSRHEDMLDLVLSLRHGAGWQPSDGARFEIHFEKARGLFGDAVRPIEARLETDTSANARWAWRPAGLSELDRVAALLKDGLNPNQVAREMGISKSKSYRLREHVVAMAATSHRRFES